MLYFYPPPPCDSCKKIDEAVVIATTIIPSLPDRVCCYFAVPPLPLPFTGTLTVFPFAPRSFCPFPSLSLTFLVLPSSVPNLVSSQTPPTIFLMSRRQHPAPQSHRTNPVITAEPIYETGPLITQPRRGQPSPYSPCVYLILFSP